MEKYFWNVYSIILSIIPDLKKKIITLTWMFQNKHIGSDVSSLNIIYQMFYNETSKWISI